MGSIRERGKGRAEITSILGRWEEAWRTHDMTAFASLLHEDGVWLLWTGDVWTGRRVIEERHAAVHKTDAVIVRSCSVLTGDERAPTEVVRSRKFLVVTRRQGVWKVSRGPKAEGLVHAVIVHWADI